MSETYYSVDTSWRPSSVGSQTQVRVPSPEPRSQLVEEQRDCAPNCPRIVPVSSRPIEERTPKYKTRQITARREKPLPDRFGNVGEAASSGPNFVTPLPTTAGRSVGARSSPGAASWWSVARVVRVTILSSRWPEIGDRLVCVQICRAINKSTLDCLPCTYNVPVRRRSTLTRIGVNCHRNERAERDAKRFRR